MDVLSEPLTDAQIRILGVLVEKQLTTPQSYPLTENALLSGCNQSTNRYPVVDYGTSDVRPALIRLRERGLAKRVMRQGERADKQAHRLDEQLGLSSVAPLAVLTVLMLRGAQTPGELRTRTQRLHPITDAAELDAALDELQGRGLAEPLPRRPGEKQVRWRHLLAGVDAPIDPTPHAPGAGSHATGSDALAEPGPGAHVGVGTAAAGSAALQRTTFEQLVDTVNRLQERVSTLERELGVTSEEDDAGLPADLPDGSR